MVQVGQVVPSLARAAIRAPTLGWNARGAPRRAAQPETAQPAIVRGRRVVPMVIVDLVEAQATHGRPVLDVADRRGQANVRVATRVSRRDE